MLTPIFTKMESILEIENASYDGRVWIKSNHAEFIEINDQSSGKYLKGRTLKFLSYHILANYKSHKLNHAIMKDSKFRNNQLLNELKTYNADILCLQDIDQFESFWHESLGSLGYNSIFCKKTDVKGINFEGVVIAYKRSFFQLTKTEKVFLNHAADDCHDRGLTFKERSQSDDVGLIALFQPISNSEIAMNGYNPPWLLVGCALFNEDDNGDDIRLIQSVYFNRQIEIFNKNYHAPILVGVSMHDNPNSSAYHVFRTGRIPIRGDVPQKCQPPKGKATCRGSVRLNWKPPVLSIADPGITHFRIAWRPGGSHILGFDLFKKVPYGDCIEYKEEIGIDGKRTHVALDELSYVISGLASDIPYEFRISAINSIGEGICSEPSLPIVMPNPSKTPMPELNLLRSLPEVIELRERINMNLLDLNANTYAVSSALNPLTGKSPRSVTGKDVIGLPGVRLLPANVNPREGFTSPLERRGMTKKMYEILNQPHVVKTSMLRNTHGQYLPHVSDTPLGLVAQTSVTKVPKVRVIQDDVSLNADKSVTQSKVSHPSYGEDSFDSPMLLNEFDENTNELAMDDLNQDSSQLQSTEFELLPTYLQFSGHFADDYKNFTILDCQFYLREFGMRSNRQVHELSLRSAYEAYSSGGEPSYTSSQPTPTISSPSQMDCFDYIFYSEGSFLLDKILTIPCANDLHGVEPMEPMMSMDLLWLLPPIGFRVFNNHSSLIVSQKTKNLIVDDFSANASKQRKGKQENKVNRRGSSFMPGLSSKRHSLEGKLIAAVRETLDPKDISQHNSQSYPSSTQTMAARYKANLKNAINRSLTYTGPIAAAIDETSMKKEILPSTKQYANAKDVSYAPGSFWAGKWASTFPTKTIYKDSVYLPTPVYCSSHIALCAELEFKPT